MPELLGVIAAMVLSCTGSPGNCPMPLETRAQLTVEEVVVIPPKPVMKPGRKAVAGVKKAAPRKLVVASSSTIVAAKPAKRRQIPIFIGAYY